MLYHNQSEFPNNKQKKQQKKRKKQKQKNQTQLSKKVIIQGNNDLKKMIWINYIEEMQYWANWRALIKSGQFYLKFIKVIGL